MQLKVVRMSCVGVDPSMIYGEACKNWIDIKQLHVGVFHNFQNKEIGHIKLIAGNNWIKVIFKLLHHK